MGIKGLPEVLRPWLTPVQVSKYRGKRAAVDAYSWLHKGAYSCALELATGEKWWTRQKRDAPYVRYCIHRAQMLRHFGVNPVIVFDGDRLPAKGNEETERRERRAEARRKGNERLAARDRDGAAFMFSQCVDVTPSMAHELIAALKREGFEFVVAPYEADAQIAALASMGSGDGEGGVDIVFTEDSDLVAYGCPTVLFKLDKFGDAQELRLADVLAGPPPLGSSEGAGGEPNERAKEAGGTATGVARGRGVAEVGRTSDVEGAGDDDSGGGGGGGGGTEVAGDKEDEDDDDMIAVSTGPKGGRGRGKAKGKGKGKKSATASTTADVVPSKAGGGADAKGRPLNFSGWTHDLFLSLCVLSGCDFLPNVRGVGIKKAHALVSKHRTIEATLAAMHGDKKTVMPENYNENFRRAFWTFRHARVYDPKLRRLRHLTPPPSELDELKESEKAFLGGEVDAAAAVEVAEGRLDPITRQPFVVPPSPQKQRPWVPPRGGGGARGSGWGGGFQSLRGGAARGGRDSFPAAAPKKPPAILNLFAKAADKAKAGGDRGGGGFDFDSHADADDDAAMAAMMENIEKNNRGERSKAAEAAAAAAMRRNDPEAMEAWTPDPSAKQARGDGSVNPGGGSGSGIPAVLSEFVMPDSARSAAAALTPGGQSATRDTGGGPGGLELGFEYEGRSQRPSWQPPVVVAAGGTAAPANKFARAAPAKRTGGRGSALANLFAAHEKRQPVQSQPQRQEQQEQQYGAKTFAAVAAAAAVPSAKPSSASSAEFNDLATLGVGGGSGGGCAQPKKGSIQSFFGGGGKRPADSGEKVWDIKELSRNSAAAKSGAYGKRRKN